MENKTIIVVYTNNKVSENSRLKRYAFNSESDLKVGDMLDSPNYDTNMQIVKVLNKAYKYYNTETGRLSNKYTSTRQFEIRDLVVSQTKNIIMAVKVEQ